MGLNRGLLESKLPLSQRSMFLWKLRRRVQQIAIASFSRYRALAGERVDNSTEVRDSHHRRLRMSTDMLRPL